MPGWAPGDVDDEEGPRGINERRQVLRLWLEESITGLVMDVTTCFLSLLSVVTYVYEVRRRLSLSFPRARALSLSPLLLVHLSRLRTSSRRVIITCTSLPPPCLVCGGGTQGVETLSSVPSVPFTYITYQQCGPPSQSLLSHSPPSHTPPFDSRLLPPGFPRLPLLSMSSSGSPSVTSSVLCSSVLQSYETDGERLYSLSILEVVRAYCLIIRRDGQR